MDLAVKDVVGLGLDSALRGPSHRMYDPQPQWNQSLKNVIIVLLLLYVQGQGTLFDIWSRCLKPEHFIQ